MTKTQRMEERIRLDDKMCAEINELLDNHGFGSEKLSYTLGEIMGCMSAAGRRARGGDWKGGTGGTEKAAG